MAHREVRTDVDARDRQEGRGQGRVHPGPFRPKFDPETNAIRFGWGADEFIARANGYKLMSMGVETLYRSPASYARDLEMLNGI